MLSNELSPLNKLNRRCSDMRSIYPEYMYVSIVKNIDVGQIFVLKHFRIY